MIRQALSDALRWPQLSVAINISARQFQAPDFAGRLLAVIAEIGNAPAQVELELLESLQRELGLSYLFITHNIGVVEYIADEVAVMQAGRIVEQGPSEQVLRSPAHAYTRTLLTAVPRLQGVA